MKINWKQKKIEKSKMPIEISVFDPTTDKIARLKVDSHELVENLKALIECEFGIPTNEQILQFHNENLKEKEAISKYKIQNSDIIMVLRQTTSNNQNMIVSEAERLKQYYINNPEQLQELNQYNPEFASAILSDDIHDLVQILSQEGNTLSSQISTQARLQELEQDPELQREIEEEIRYKNIDENFEYAQEYVPENFGHITMLYIEIFVNKHPIQAFVDSGAESTIMSKQCAERCGIMRLVDQRFAGMALGVGMQKIIGRIHAIDIQILNKIFPCAITVLDGDGIDFLLGLDMLKRYQCSIDLVRNKLIFQSSNLEVSFLSEGEIHKQVSIEKEKQVFEEAEKRRNLNRQIQNPSLTQNKIQSTIQQPSMIQKTQNKIQSSNQSSQIKQQTQQQQQRQKMSKQSLQQNFPKNKKKEFQPNEQENKIQKLIVLGFDRNQAIQALSSTNGSFDLAATLLTQQKFGL